MGAEQIEGWFRYARSTKAFPSAPQTNVVDFVSGVILSALTLPFDADLILEPRLYVDIHSASYNDKFLINSINNSQASARFVCVPERVQNNADGDPVWIHYKSLAEQVLRLNRKEPLVFTIYLRDMTILDTFESSALPPDPTQQIIASFSATPLLKDSHFSNPQSEVSTVN